MWCVSCYLYVYCVVLYVVRELVFICLLCCIEMLASDFQNITTCCLLFNYHQL
jgi:hypothetical protein